MMAGSRRQAAGLLSKHEAMVWTQKPHSVRRQNIPKRDLTP